MIIVNKIHNSCVVIKLSFALCRIENTIITRATNEEPLYGQLYSVLIFHPFQIINHLKFLDSYIYYYAFRHGIYLNAQHLRI
jgi:hypothetical protein